METVMDRDGRNCPVTRGNPTSTTRRGWDAACAACRQEAEAEQDYAYRHVMYKGVCLICSQQIPAEVTIIDLAHYNLQTEKGMGTNKTVTGVCKYCKQTKRVRQIGDGQGVCSMCEAVRSTIRNHPQSVIDSIRELAPDLLQVPSQQAELKTAFAKEHLDKCERVLIAIGETIKAEADEDLVEVAKRRMNTMARLEESYLKESVALSNAEAERDDLKRQLQGMVTGEVEMVCDTDRTAVQDLAIRLAVCMLKGEVRGIGVSDVELLRAMA